MKPSLDNAYARASRAKQHLARLKRETTIFSRSKPVQAYIDPKFGGTLKVTHAPGYISRSASTRMSILIGEIIYNLRAALDYLVYELAILDSGEAQEGTQFPIESSPQGWHRRKDGTKRKVAGNIIPDYGCYLKGLSATHKAIIELFQPCFGCDWTGTLQSLSNPDKHRTLTIIWSRSTVTATPYNPVGVISGEESKTVIFQAALNRSGNSMNVNTDVAFDIALNDGTPIIKTLQILQSQVTQVLDQFKPEFK